MDKSLKVEKDEWKERERGDMKFMPQIRSEF